MLSVRKNENTQFSNAENALEYVSTTESYHRCFSRMIKCYKLG